jgi:hypothetical protein
MAAMTTARFIVAGLSVIPFIVSLQSTVEAQNCAIYPKGPERAQCLKQYYPEVFDTKQQHCKELAQQRGSWGFQMGEKTFAQSCMQGTTK